MRRSVARQRALVTEILLFQKTHQLSRPLLSGASLESFVPLAASTKTRHFAAGSSHRSPKKPAVTMPPGAREETGTLTSTTA